MSIDTDHVVSEPAILYVGTPVVLISTRNADGSANLAPMSSAWWLGWRCVLGLGGGHTAENLERERECVLNLPPADLVGAVDRLAMTTGAASIPERKQQRGYRYEPAKFGVAGLDAQPSQTVAPPRVAQCPIQLEAVVEDVHPLGGTGTAVVVETRVQRVHLSAGILADGEPNRVDPDRWRPLIMSFQRFYGLADGQVAPSTLAGVPERLYRTEDVDRAREVPNVASA